MAKPKIDTSFRTLYCDPGEDFGWATGVGLTLVARGTTKMWEFADDLWDALNNPSNPSNFLNSAESCRDGVDPALNLLPIKRIVCEDFRIYPWVAKSGGLNWDPMRTPRVIGALTMMSRIKGIPVVFQPAAIKEGAKAAGAEELYDRPLDENRHQNDAIQHYAYDTATNLLGLSFDTNDRQE